ncbi:long-chain acyl-CoA synthetase [Marinobacterium nitratireducens]|uniref:Long-chain acyl-CoA synthetase n=1 Tax=Marinobacterium nitratireducens TaxID=518897 RepID=A0A918DWJ2_9GAMM|nr:AMP-binding protein [Marinobacterium nitratireducens]GGO86760.1 long-chain acyl-CoA synthetase [Marinobacterium nitratireducens]
MLFDTLALALEQNDSALQTETETLAGSAVLARAGELATKLERQGVRRLGILLDNGADWAIADLAALQAGIAAVPIPGFFTPAQRRHLTEDAALDAILAAAPLPGLTAGNRTACGYLHRLTPPASVSLPEGTAKITYTSGTTGEPKGVCLSQDNMLAVARALQTATTPLKVRRHLCLLPLAVLLENIAGLYVPWLSGACVTLLPMSDLGIRGAAGADPAAMLGTLTQWQPHSLILVPALLPVILAGRQQGLPDSYRCLALGGGRTAASLQQRARALRLPLYEGYGLSEAASVVAFNHPGAERPGSVGRPLPHVEVSIGPNGDVRVRGNRFLGYLGEAAPEDDGWLDTGDRGHIDADGYLVIDGRRKNTIVTAMGRNLAPEWLEAELCDLPDVDQAFVYGDESIGIQALVVSRQQDPRALQRALDDRLPDYARLTNLHITTRPFTRERGELTANGRLRRAVLTRRIKEASWDFSTA